MRLLGLWLRCLIQAGAVVFVWNLTRPLCIQASHNRNFIEWMGLKIGQIGHSLAVHLDWWGPVLAISLTLLFFRLVEFEYYLRKRLAGQERKRRSQSGTPDNSSRSRQSSAEPGNPMGFPQVFGNGG